MKKLKQNLRGIYTFSNGITLINLVITIVILIILASVIIYLSLGNNGIFTRAKQAKEIYKQSAAKEKVEIVLLDAVIEKNGNPAYSSEEFLNNMLEESGIEVNGNVVTVDNYNFTIDRENLKIVTENGESNIKVTKEVESYLGKNANEKYEAQILVTIESDKELQNVIIENPDGTTFKLETNNTKIAKDMTVEFDKAYKVIITTKEGKTTTRTIIEKSVETINSVAQFLEFRDKVNSNLTYEGKTINQTNDLDLSSICGETLGSFEPIGNNKPFKGTFDGQNHKIKNIYINKASKYNALFARIFDAELRNIEVESGYISQGTEYTAGICCYADSSIINNCTNKVRIESTSNNAAGIVVVAINTKVLNCRNLAEVSSPYGVAGIVCNCHNGNEIINCYNTGYIHTLNIGSPLNHYFAGGIVGNGNGNADGFSKIENCYNMGNIYGKTNSAGICSYLERKSYINISNCYSKGTITGGEKYAISGKTGNTSKYNLSNNYWLTNCGASSGSYLNANTNAVPKTEAELKALASILGDSYIEDGKKIDKEGDVVDNLDKDGNIIYINDNYPILKWQVTEK